MPKTQESVQVPSLTCEEEGDEAAVTLIDSTQGIHIWFETVDGEASHVFTEDQFNGMVTAVRQLKGWV